MDIKLEATYTLTCDKCGEIFYSSDGFPSPQLCPKCLKPVDDKELREGITQLIWEQCLPDDYGTWRDDKTQHPELAEAVRNGAIEILTYVRPLIEAEAEITFEERASEWARRMGWREPE